MTSNINSPRDPLLDEPESVSHWRRGMFPNNDLAVRIREELLARDLARLLLQHAENCK